MIPRLEDLSWRTADSQRWIVIKAALPGGAVGRITRTPNGFESSSLTVGDHRYNLEEAPFDWTYDV